jgi:hypothetical protein
MRTFHGLFAYLVIALNLGAGLWGLLFVRKRPVVPRSFLATIVAGQVAVAVQAVTGVIFLRQLDEQPGFHAFYGFVVLIAAVLSWAFRKDTPSRTVMTFSIVAVFIGAVAIRGFTVAGR